MVDIPKINLFENLDLNMWEKFGGPELLSLALLGFLWAVLGMIALNYLNKKISTTLAVSGFILSLSLWFKHTFDL